MWHCIRTTGGGRKQERGVTVIVVDEETQGVVSFVVVET